MEDNGFIAISDIHGHSTELNLLLEQVANNPVYANRNSWPFIFLGDYIDRGPNSFDVLAIVDELVEKGQAIALMGNHEQMYMNSPEKWDGLSIPTENETVARGIIAKLKLYHDTKHFFFSHAGLKYPQAQLEDLEAYDFLWTSSPSYQGFQNKIQVRGHTIVKSVVEQQKLISIDTGLYKGGNLSAVALSNLSERVCNVFTQPAIA